MQLCFHVCPSGCSVHSYMKKMRVSKNINIRSCTKYNFISTILQWQDSFGKVMLVNHCSFTGPNVSIQGTIYVYIHKLYSFINIVLHQDVEEG